MAYGGLTHMNGLWLNGEQQELALFWLVFYFLSCYQLIYFDFYSTQQVNINPSYQPLELKYALNKVGIKTLVAAESFKNLDYFSILNEAVPEIKETQEMDFIKSREVPTLESVIMISDRIEKYEGWNSANICKRILMGFFLKFACCQIGIQQRNMALSRHYANGRQQWIEGNWWNSK